MTAGDQRARARSVGYAGPCMLVALVAVALLFLLVVGYGSAHVYDLWREVLNKHNALIYVMDVQPVASGVLAGLAAGVGYAIGRARAVRAAP